MNISKHIFDIKTILKYFESWNFYGSTCIILNKKKIKNVYYLLLDPHINGVFILLFLTYILIVLILKSELTIFIFKTENQFICLFLLCHNLLLLPVVLHDNFVIIAILLVLPCLYTYFSQLKWEVKATNQVKLSRAKSTSVLLFWFSEPVCRCVRLPSDTDFSVEMYVRLPTSYFK